ESRYTGSLRPAEVSARWSSPAPASPAMSPMATAPIATTHTSSIASLPVVVGIIVARWPGGNDPPRQAGVVDERVEGAPGQRQQLGDDRQRVLRGQPALHPVGGARGQVGRRSGGRVEVGAHASVELAEG